MDTSINRMQAEHKLNELLKDYHLNKVSGSTEKLIKTAFDGIKSLGEFSHQLVLHRIGKPDLDEILIGMGEDAFEYIDYAIENAHEEPLENTIRLLGKFGEIGFERLVSMFENEENKQVFDNLSIEILNFGDKGVEVINGNLNSNNILLRRSAVSGIRWIFNNSIADSAVEREEIFDNWLIEAIKDEDPYVRRIAVIGLGERGKLSLDDIDNLIEDEDAEVRGSARDALRRLRITDASARIFVKAIEDSVVINSDVAINTIKELFRTSQDIEIIAKSIIDVLIIRDTGRPDEYFNPDVVTAALSKCIQISPTVLGVILYRLVDISIARPGSIRRRCISIAKKINKDEFISLVEQKGDEYPKEAKEIFQQIFRGEPGIEYIADQISSTRPGDIQQNAANQLKLLAVYQSDALKQVNSSFRWAITFNVFSLIALFLVLRYLIITGSDNIVAILTGIGSVFAQFLAGTQFYLYNQARKQLESYHQQMNQTQRFLLANSICETLEGEEKDKTRSALVQIIASAKPTPPFTQDS